MARRCSDYYMLFAVVDDIPPVGRIVRPGSLAPVAAVNLRATPVGALAPAKELLA
jgi:hypothetical protein